MLKYKLETTGKEHGEKGARNTSLGTLEREKGETPFLSKPIQQTIDSEVSHTQTFMGSEDMGQRPQLSVESVIVEEGFKMFSLPNFENDRAIGDEKQAARNKRAYRQAPNLKAAVQANSSKRAI